MTTAEIDETAHDAPRPATLAPRPGRARARGSIILARHGRPALDRSMTMDWRGYKEWWSAYDAGGLATGQAPGEALLAAAASAEAVLASPLRRSQETARAVAAGRPVLTDPLFLEAPLPPPPIPGLRLKPRQWGVVSRISWWLGHAGGMESRREAEGRAAVAAERVIALAHAVDDDRAVVVCAHGWFNRMMRPALVARGWRCVEDHGDTYWSFRRYEHDW